jgi:hypothetical protein
VQHPSSQSCPARHERHPIFAGHACSARAGLTTLAPAWTALALRYDVPRDITIIAKPCGHRFSGDLTGFGALASKGRCGNGHQPG